MEKSILLGGYGGQGVQTIGKLLAVAIDEAGSYVSFVPAYGGRMRGGTSNCTVVASDKEIAAPMREKLDVLICLNEPSKRAFENRLVPGGLLIYNSSMVITPPERGDIRAVGLPATELAEGCGSDKAVNVIVLSFFTRFSGILPVEVMRRVVERELSAKKPQFAELNRRAFEAGLAAAEAELKKDF